MIQVKLFEAYEMQTLERDLNRFLSSGEVAEVIDVKFSTVSHNSIFYMALVIYRK